MTTEKHAGFGRIDPELLEMPQIGWQTVTFWASRFGLSRESFVKKLKTIGIRSNFFDLVLAEDLFLAIERHDNGDEERKGRSRLR